jgi:ferritin-like metal-binding protein YciE
MGDTTENDPQAQLVKYLTDAHSIEEQALTQLRQAPKVAGSGQLAQVFRGHLTETEVHERRVRERLEALGASPSRAKDLAGKAGGVGMLLFAVVNPDTPGKLTAHAFSYEHMETATYELLQAAARHAGDEETARMADEIAAEERRMAERLQGCFDEAAQMSLDAGGDNVSESLNSYLADAHAIEQQAKSLLQAGPGLVHDEQLARLFREHLDQTLEHARQIALRLEARGAKPSKIKDVALKVGAMNVGAFFGAQPDTDQKLAGFAYAFENLEIASYELLRRVATTAGDPETAATAERILADEHDAASKLAATWRPVMAARMG